MNCYYNGHKGTVWAGFDEVVFYGVLYNNITIAIRKLLNHILPGDYSPWCYGCFRGVKDKITDKIFVEERWFDNDTVAELFLKCISKNYNLI